MAGRAADAGTETVNDLPLNPLKWHSDEYAAKKVEGIRNRPPMYKRNLIINDDIDWLIEEVERLRAERDEALARVREPRR